MKTRHLLFLTPGFPENEQDDRCIPALQLFVEELAKRTNIKISVITFHYPYKEETYYWNEVKVFALGGKNKKGAHRIFLLRKALSLAKKINKVEPLERVHSFWLGECTWVGNRIARSSEIKHSCTLMGQDVLNDNTFFRKLKKIPPLIALSRFHAQALYENRKIHPQYIIPWGIRKEEVLKKAIKEVDIVGVGWLNEVKAFNRFIQIISLVKKEIPEIRAEIIGEGVKKEALERLIQEKGLEFNVTLTGGLSRKKTLERIAESRALLHTASFESFGMVLIESLALRTKVFSSPVGIAPELKEATTYVMNEEVVSAIVSFLRTDSIIEPKTPFDIRTTVDSYLNTVF